MSAVRAFFDLLEDWVFDEDNIFIGVSKLFLVVGVVVTIIFGPLVWWSAKADREAQAECLASGNAWAVIGSHYQTTLMPVGKVMVPMTQKVTDYGCVSRP